VTGYTQVEQFTVTAGASPSKNPTISITFPMAFPQTPICSASHTGGTNPVISFFTTSVTRSAAVFTLQGIPTAIDTMVVLVRCGL
jgi:hypothetical protein